MNIIQNGILMLIAYIIYKYYMTEYKSYGEVNINKDDYIKNIIKILVRSCARWSLASLQDTSPLVAVLHANYASGYLWALREIFTDTEIYNATGINIIKFEKRITDIQDKATKKMMVVCPKFSTGIDIQLAKLGGNL